MFAIRSFTLDYRFCYQIRDRGSYEAPQTCSYQAIIQVNHINLNYRLEFSKASRLFVKEGSYNL